MLQTQRSSFYAPHAHRSATEADRDA